MNKPASCIAKAILCVALGTTPFPGQAQSLNPSDLSSLKPGQTKAVNALWIENPLSAQFKSSRRVVVADLKGPAEITMIHFAYPAKPSLNRDLLLRIYWDDETNASVDCPLVDFFCDPNGSRQVVNTALVNVRRGFNTYFPMPFRKSAKIELTYDGPTPAGDKLWQIMPCYSYVCYRTLKNVPRDAGYFCASWRQDAVKLGLRDYVALEAKGKGKLVGWNVTVRLPGRAGYPVDENEKFYIDGETNASIEFQGLEDSFGFSWGFPESENMFPYTGYFPFLRGAAAYRFFIQDSISFEKSLKVAIGFGEHESPFFRREFSKFGTSLEFSSVVYWYQIEPHAPLPPMPVAAARAPAPEKPDWPEQETPPPSASDYQKRGVKLAVFCGRPGGETIYHEQGYAISMAKNPLWDGWTGDVYYCRQDPKDLALELTVPKGVAGAVRMFIIDSDNFMGGRRETLLVGGKPAGTFENFQNGRWVEVAVTPEQTSDGKLSVHALNGRDDANAVISKLEWLENQPARD